MLEVEVFVGTDTTKQLFRKLRDETSALKIIDEASAIILNRIRTRFLAEVDPDEIPWRPSEAALKRRSKGGTGTLFKTGRLFHSIQLSPVQVAGTGQQDIAQTSIYTDVEYGKYHQYGTKRLPIRRFLGTNDNDMQVFADRLAARLNRALSS